MYQCDRRFWLEHPANLLCDYTVLPLENMSPGTKLNTLTRLVVFLALLLHVTDSKYTLWFLALSLVCILCLYYYQRTAMNTVERFENARVDFSTNPVVKNPVVAHFKDLSVDTPSSKMPFQSQGAGYAGPVANFQMLVDSDNTAAIKAVLGSKGKRQVDGRTKTEVLADLMDYELSNARSKPGYDQSCNWKPKETGGAGFKSRFENLYKGADPRTMVPPNITPRHVDWSAWDRGDLYMPSYINSKRAFDMVGSGYLPQDDDECGYITPKATLRPDQEYKYPLVHQFPTDPNHTQNYENMWNFARPQTLRERAQTLPDSFDSKDADIELSLGAAAKAIDVAENFKMLGGNGGCATCPSSQPVVENFSPTNPPMPNTYQLSSMNGKGGSVTMNSYQNQTPSTTNAVYDGDVLTRCGYNRDNLLHNVPVNTSVGACDLRDSMNDYNKDLYSINVQPGVVYRSQIQLPISSNIGISYNQTLPITSQTVDEDGNVILTDVDPRTFNVVDDPVSRGDDEPTIFDMYDTRDTGYGPEYRGYVHKLTGQPRWYYGDIDAVQKNEINVFSDIDILEKADKRGFMVTNDEVRARASGFQKYVDNEFVERTNNARIQLQQNFADKSRDPVVQQRRQPIMRLGGMTQKCFR